MELLDLSTIVQRETISIKSKAHPKGKVYELRNLADFGPLQYAWIYQANQDVEQLKTLKKPTPAQERRLKKLLDDMVKLVCRDKIEPAVLAALTDEQKQMIIFSWSHHTQSAADGAAEGNARPPRRTTGGSSRVSKPSTAVTPKRGSTSQRG